MLITTALPRFEGSEVTVTLNPCRWLAFANLLLAAKSLSEKPYKRHPYAAYTDA